MTRLLSLPDITRTQHISNDYDAPYQLRRHFPSLSWGEAVTSIFASHSGECTYSGEPGEATDQTGLGPPAAKPESIARTDDGETEKNERVDEVIVHEHVILRWQRRAPHQDEQDRSGDGGDSHADTKQQRHSDPKEADHEHPVHPACACDSLVDAREGTNRAAKEALAGGASVDPCVG